MELSHFMCINKFIYTDFTSKIYFLRTACTLTTSSFILIRYDYYITILNHIL